MSETPFFPESPAFDIPAPLQPKSEQDASELAAPAMEEQLARARAREEAFARMYKQYREQLLRYVRRCLKAVADAEDFMHDVMLGAWKNDVTGRCAGVAKCIESYLMVSMKRRVFDEFRKQGRTRRTLADFAASLLTKMIDRDATYRRAEARDIERHVHRLIWELPPRCREAFVARQLFEMSPHEAATYLGISVKTVSVQVTKAQWFLRTKLAALGYYYRPDLLSDEKEDTP